MADDARLAEIERTLTRLEQSVREGWALVDKRFDDFRREAERGQQELTLRVMSRFGSIDQRFTDLQERLTGMEGRLEALDGRLDSRLAGIDDRLNTRLMGVEGRLSAIESRLDHKADKWTVNLWGATLAILIAAATAFIKFPR
jgi:hypothetical protein